MYLVFDLVEFSHNFLLLNTSNSLASVSMVEGFFHKVSVKSCHFSYYTYQILWWVPIRILDHRHCGCHCAGSTGGKEIIYLWCADGEPETLVNFTVGFQQNEGFHFWIVIVGSKSSEEPWFEAKAAEYGIRYLKGLFQVS